MGVQIEMPPWTDAMTPGDLQSPNQHKAHSASHGCSTQPMIDEDTQTQDWGQDSTGRCLTWWKSGDGMAVARLRLALATRASTGGIFMTTREAFASSVSSVKLRVDSGKQSLDGLMLWDATSDDQAQRAQAGSRQLCTGSGWGQTGYIYNEVCVLPVWVTSSMRASGRVETRGLHRRVS